MFGTNVSKSKFEQAIPFASESDWGEIYFTLYSYQNTFILLILTRRIRSRCSLIAKLVSFNFVFAGKFPIKSNCITAGC